MTDTSISESTRPGRHARAGAASRESNAIARLTQRFGRGLVSTLRVQRDYGGCAFVVVRGESEATERVNVSDGASALYWQGRTYRLVP